MFFKERLPEDGQNSWPKHVAGNAVCNTKTLYVIIHVAGKVVCNTKSLYVIIRTYRFVSHMKILV